MLFRSICPIGKMNITRMNNISCNTNIKRGDVNGTGYTPVPLSAVFRQPWLGRFQGLLCYQPLDHQPIRKCGRRVAKVSFGCWHMWAHIGCAIGILPDHRTRRFTGRAVGNVARLIRQTLCVGGECDKLRRFLFVRRTLKITNRSKSRIWPSRPHPKAVLRQRLR